MPRKKKWVRVPLPDGVTRREVMEAVARLRRSGETKSPLDVAVDIVAEREAVTLSAARDQAAPPPDAVLS